MDGGFVALSGFYFQFLATFSDYGERVILGSHQDNGIDYSDTLLGVEIRDQDAVQVQSKKARIIQIKFSNKPDEKDIKPGDANEILKKMHEFADQHFPEAAGWEREFVLLTNRSQSDHVKKIASDKLCASATNYPSLKSYLDTSEWRLRTSEQCWQLVEEMGREFGMTGDRNQGEISRGVGHVWKSFLENVVTKHGWLTKDQVEQLFTGHPQPRRLNRNDTRQCVQHTVTEFLRSAKLETGNGSRPLVERPALLDDIRQAITEYSLVVVEGQGGNGKSTLVGQIALYWAQDAFAAGILSSELKQTWPSDCISDWRNVPLDQRLQERTQLALQRMPHLWPFYPVVVFALDGVDEANLSDVDVRSTIVEFRDLAPELRSRASLVITCRDVRQIGCLHHIPESDYKVINVDTFTLKELKNSLESGRISLRDDVAANLLPAVDSLTESSILSSDLYYATPIGDFESMRRRAFRAPSAVVIRQETVNSLRHPIVWKHFCSSSLDDDKRLLILNGDVAAWDILAESVVLWFGDRCQHHIHPGLPELSHQAIEVILAVGKACPSFEENYRKSEWSAVAACPGLHSHQVMTIFRQAISSGLIEGDDNPLGSSQWRWRHSFLPRYLSTKAQEVL